MQQTRGEGGRGRGNVDEKNANVPEVLVHCVRCAIKPLTRAIHLSLDGFDILIVPEEVGTLSRSATNTSDTMMSYSLDRFSRIQTCDIHCKFNSSELGAHQNCTLLHFYISPQSRVPILPPTGACPKPFHLPFHKLIILPPALNKVI